MVTWPSSLPQSPMATSYSEVVPNNIIRTEMDSGAAKVRRRTTAAPRFLRISYIMDKTQIATLDDFYLTSLKSGSLKFSFTNPRTNMVENVRFMKQPEYISENGNYFRVNLTLEVMP